MSTRDKASISNPKVNRGCAPLTDNRTSADCVQISFGPSIPYIPLGVYHTGRFNAMNADPIYCRIYVTLARDDLIISIRFYDMQLFVFHTPPMRLRGYRMANGRSMMSKSNEIGKYMLLTLQLTWYFLRLSVKWHVHWISNALTSRCVAVVYLSSSLCLERGFKPLIWPLKNSSRCYSEW